MTSVTSAASMKLLDLRLKHAGSIIASAIGEYTSSSSSGTSTQSQQQEIACLRAGGTIDIYRIVITQPTLNNSNSNDDDDEEEEEEITTTLQLVSRVETRSTLRSIRALRIAGSKKDVLIIGSDSGCFSILDFDTNTNSNNTTPQILHCPTYGKSGIRRDTPGQYLASDPRGRACMISSIEKRKLVYVIHRDSSGKVTLASPLDAHRPRTVVYDTVGVDNGYDNPIFASLEVEYE